MPPSNPIPDRFWVVVAEWDDGNWQTYINGSGYSPPGGPFVFEGYCMTEEQADRRVRDLGDRHGWVRKFMVETADTPLIVGGS